MIMDDRLFERLCRVISLTEQRGMKQVDILLKHPLVKHDKTLMRIFRIIEKDEPSHWAPYDNWLKAHGGRDPKWWERAIDTFIHSRTADPQAAGAVLQSLAQAPHRLGGRARPGRAARLADPAAA